MREQEIFALFVPHILERQKALGGDKRLVHYTSAEAAYRIITTGQIWLRNAQVMNDFSEIAYGIKCLTEAWRSEGGKALQGMLERIKEGLNVDLAALFDGHADELRQNTFIISLSEHGGGEEDRYGRLSMWRAYGRRSGVALLLNNTAFTADTTEMHVFSSPVFYKDIDAFVGWFTEWANKIIAAEKDLKSLEPDKIKNLFFLVFRSFALCTKHPGFAEEKEWRIFYSATFGGQSEWIEPSIEIVNGTPQRLMRLHLKDAPAKGIIGVAPHTLLNGVIIGPCEYPYQVRDAIASALQQVGILNPIEMISTSLIPLRQ